jgi:phage regulator Rha-like protein
MNQAVKRNSDKFPEDFMFRLSAKEWEFIQLQTNNPNSSQIVMSSKNSSSSQIVMMDLPKNRTGKYLPFAFTQHGVTMIASVLRSKKAIDMNIAIVRAFTAMRRFAKTNKNLFDQTQELRAEMQARLGERDVQLTAIYDALENMLDKKQDEVDAKEKWDDRERIGFKK